MKKYYWLLVVVISSLVPLVDLLRPGFPLTHDGIDHVARIANFYNALNDGNLIPRWAANLNWGYGHPILMFLYPLPSYFASLFHFLGATFVDSTKFVFALAYIASGISMYIWLQSFLSRRAACIGALAYLFAPYRFVDLYVRGAIGEHVAFIFPPLICFAIVSSAHKKNPHSLIVGAVAVAGLLLSHNAISLMFLPVMVLYTIFVFFKEKPGKIFFLKVMAFAVGGFALSAFFWLPAFFEGKYTLRDIVTKNEYKSRFETWQRFLYSSWSYGGTGYFSVQVGITQWIGIAISPFVIWRYYVQKNKIWIVGLVTLIMIGITLFLMTADSQFIWEKLTILQKFQFPWRLLTLVVFFSALLLALVINNFKERLQLFVVSAVVVLLLITNINYWHAKGYSNHPESYYTSIYYGTTDTGESAPIWSVRFMEKEPKKPTEIIDGDAIISEEFRDSVTRTYLVSANKRSRVLENTLYFPGWKVRVDGQDAPIEFQDQRYRGLITYFVPEGKHRVQISFSETKLRFVADMISIVAIVILVAYAVYLQTAILWKRSR